MTKKTLLSLLFGFIATMSLTSCVTPTYASDVIVEHQDDDVNISVVLHNGVPTYYDDGYVMYYLYNGWYYYPYFYNNTWYYYRYTSPIVSVTNHHRFVPHVTHRPYGRITPNNRHFRPYRGNRELPRRSSTYRAPNMGNHNGGAVNHSIGNRTNRMPQQNRMAQPNIGRQHHFGGQIMNSAPRGGQNGSRGFGGHR